MRCSYSRIQIPFAGMGDSLCGGRWEEGAVEDGALCRLPCNFFLCGGLFVIFETTVQPLACFVFLTIS